MHARAGPLPATGGDGSALPAGRFSTWLGGMLRALAGDGGSEVPCGTCTACCRSSQFVTIEADEAETLARIPAELLFPAPRMPRGSVVLGYDEQGRCPMLVDDGCSIYEHRPRTCRTYDCRVFPAAGVDIADDGQRPIAERARRWRFDHPVPADDARHDAVRAAARFVREHGDRLPEGTGPVNATEHALLAVRLHEAFIGHDAGTDALVVVADPDPDAVGVVLSARRGR